MSREIGKLSMSIAPEALRSIVGDGRLLELADSLAREAATQIAAQLVDQVAQAAVKGDGLKGGASAAVSFIFDGGDFGTVPPRPHWGVVALDELAAGMIRRVAAVDARAQAT